MNNLEEYFSSEVNRFKLRYTTDSAFRERFSIWTELASRNAPEAGSLIDVGCGTGIFSMHYARKDLHVIGVDASPGMIKECEKELRTEGLGHVTFLQDTLPGLERLGDATADLVICSSVLEYVVDLKASLIRLRALLRPGGVLIVSVPNARSIFRRLERLSFKIIRKPAYLQYVVHRFTAAQFSEIAGTVGLRTIESVPFAHADVASRTLRGIGGVSSLSGNLIAFVMRAS